MDMLKTLGIAASGLTAQRVRLETVASNMANARTTRTEDGGPYRRRAPVFEARNDRFEGELDRHLATVEVADIIETDDELSVVYDPGHPDADEDGYVTYPNVNILQEMVDLMTTSRAYEANAHVVTVTQKMCEAALNIGRS